MHDALMPDQPPNDARYRAMLFPDAQDSASTESRLTQSLAQIRARLPQGRVAPDLDRKSLAAELAAFDFVDPVPLPELLDWTLGVMERGMVQITHPRYFGLFNPAPSFPAECAERIVAAFNPQLASATTSPAPVAIEAHVIAAVARRLGLPRSAGGHFTSGGSEANFTALLCALHRREPRFITEGARAFSGPPCIYISQDAHLAWFKLAQQAGIGRDAVRVIGTDGGGRIDTAALEATVSADVEAGAVPVMVAATAGTTGAGMIDPIESCAAIAHLHGIWLHVDAAWGGAAIASERLRRQLAGIDAADSVTLDAHKWFATTMACGMFLARDAAPLPAVFAVANSYMPSHDGHADPYMSSVQWSRRFLGLRLFLSLAAAGWAGYGAHVEHAIARIATVRRTLLEDGWLIANASPLAVLCVAPSAGAADARSVVRKVVASGRAWVSAAVFEGRDVVRICLTNGRTTEHDVAALIDALRDAVHEDPPSTVGHPATPETAAATE